MENNFKGTIGKVYAIEYAGFININDDDYYVANNILDFEMVGEETAKTNAKLITDAFNIRQQINCDLPEFFERYNKAVDLLGKLHSHYQDVLNGDYSNFALRSEIDETNEFLKTLE